MNVPFRLLSVVLAFGTSLAAVAADEATDETTEEAATGEAAAAPKKAAVDDTGINDKPFHILPVCTRLEGIAEVERPGMSGWEAMEEGKFYPLGSIFRTVGAKSQLVLMLGRFVSLTLEGDSRVGTRAQGLGAKDRMITLLGGTVALKVPGNFPEGLLVVSTPGFVVQNPAGESRYTMRDTGDGNEVTVRCVTGVLTVKGRHYTIPSMRAANELKIRTTADNLFSGLYGTSGDFLVELDQGVIQTMDVETQQLKTEPKTLVWKLSPKTAIRIQRAVPAVGARMAVTTMTFDASGLLKNRCAFTEGLYEVNTGEQGPASKKDREALEKRAAEASETVEAEAEEPAEGAEGAAEASSSASTEEL